MNWIIQKLSSLSASDWAAWWGAILATIIFAWELYKWLHSGPRLRVTAHPNMQQAVGGKLENARYIVVNVTNIGDARTTITHLCLYYYRSKWAVLRNKPFERMVVVQVHLGQPLPVPLDAGDTWSGLIDQTEDKERMLKEGFLHCAIIEARRDKPWMSRINPKSE